MSKEIRFTEEEFDPRNCPDATGVMTDPNYIPDPNGNCLHQQAETD